MASIRDEHEESVVTSQQDISGKPSFLSPSKLISLHRQSNGFGFTLRHFVVYPPELIRKSSESSPSPGVNGIDHHDDDVERQKAEPMDTVFVRQVAPSGPADRAGLSTGDQILSVNGQPVMGKSYSQVIELIVASQELLELGIIPKEDCVLQMVTPTLTVSSKISVSSQDLSQSPPSVKAKPLYRRRSSGETPGKVLSTATFSPSNSYHLRMSERTSQSVTSLNREAPTPVVTLRRGSVDRTAMENRSYVITSDSLDYNSNLKSQSSSALESSASAPRMEGSYFMATTDSTGRPLALRFEKSSKVGNTLTVLEDSRSKTLSHSLPIGDYQGIGEHNRASGRVSAPSRVNTLNVTDIYGPENDSCAPVSIPSFTLSSPSLSTTYMNTDADVGSRQPVASDPGFQKVRQSQEETAPKTYLIKTITSHMNKDHQGGLKSSTMGTTLLESGEGHHQWQNGGNGRRMPIDSSHESHKDIASPHPAKVPRQSDDSMKQDAYSSQISVFPNKPSFKEVSFSPAFGTFSSEAETSQLNKQGSPKPRRVSYLMATSRSSPSSPEQRMRASSPQDKKSTSKSSVFQALSTMLPPVMVHVSSGMEVCEDMNEEEGMDITLSKKDEEVFQDSLERKVTSESSIQRTNRRTSYVMATSSASSNHQPLLESTKEEEEPREGDLVPGILEVCKEGPLWRKLAVVDGGKRSSARSWKPVFAVLRGHVLYLYKDKSSAHQEDCSDEQPISIKSSIVDIAHDYTKRKNVFRLTTFNGSEFLFQSDDHDSMMSWIAALQANNNPDEDENGVSSQSLIIRRMKTVEQETSGSNNTSPSHKLSPPSNTKIPGIAGISNFKKSFKNITTGQKGDSGKSQTSKLTKKRKKPQHPNSYPPGHSIGVPLENCPPSKNSKMIPLIVEHCCNVVERKGLETVGVYRVPGNSAAVTAMHEELNNRGIENVCLEEEKWNDVNNITSLLKLFLRKLPEGLVTADLYDGFIESNKKEDGAERMLSLRSSVRELPNHNFETLKYLVNHLKVVSENCEKNKMEVRNLAIVFGPTIIRTGDDSMMAMVKDMSDQCRIVETLITECEWFFEEVEGDGCPVQPCHDTTQENQLCSQSVLISLGQVAVSFGEDGSYKPKSSGISLHMPKFLGSKSSKSDSGQGSSSDGPLSDSQGSEGSPPAERAPVVSVLSGEGSRSNSPTLERASKMSGKKVTDSSSSSMQLLIDSSDTELRVKGVGSLKAYSYSHPPPPSYRRVGPQKRASSPGTPEQSFAPLETSFIVAQDSESRKSLEESRTEAGNTPKPSFSSFSEETRRRLLRLNLQKKAEEKRRQSEELSSPPVERTDEIVRDFPRDFQRKLSDQDSFENNEQLSSSSSTSHSSSAHSSKNPSLDSLHVTPQPDKMTIVPIVLHGEAPRVNNTAKALSTSNYMHQESKPRSSNETVVAVVKGRGVVSGMVRPFDPTRRPASLDIALRRESAEDARLARRSLGSEESSDTSSDEGDECAISMSKTFDEKLRSLLDLGNSLDSKASDDDKSSVQSEPLKKQVLTSEDMAQRRSSEQPGGRIYKVVGVSPARDSFASASTLSSWEISLSKNDSQHDKSESELRSSSIVQINARKYFANPAGEEHNRYYHDLPSSGTRVSVEEKTPKASDSRHVGALRQRFEIIPGRVSSSSPGSYATAPGNKNRMSAPTIQGKMTSYGVKDGLSPQEKQGKVRGSQESISRQGTQGKNKEPVSSVRENRVGAMRTATPVSPREFSMQPGSAKAQSSHSGRGGMQRAPESRTPTSRSIRLESSPARHSSTTPSRHSMERSDASDNRNVRSRLNLGPAAGERSKGQPFAGRTQLAPKMMTRDHGTKSKFLTHKDSAKELLPSKNRMPPRDARESQAQRKLEKDAQHIAELLEEMHTERHLHLSRQQSDISGQAQKAAAQRAAMRRRRRSLGDDSDPDAPLQNRVPEQRRDVSQGASRAPLSYGIETRSHGSSRDNYTRSGYHTVRR